jgi:hypothetical protein
MTTTAFNKKSSVPEVPWCDLVLDNDDDNDDDDPTLPNNNTRNSNNTTTMDKEDSDDATKLSQGESSTRKDNDEDVTSKDEEEEANLPNIIMSPHQETLILSSTTTIDNNDAAATAAATDDEGDQDPHHPQKNKSDSPLSSSNNNNTNNKRSVVVTKLNPDDIVLQELNDMIRTAEDYEIEDDMDMEVVKCLRRAALQSAAYTKHWYDAVSDSFWHIPTLAGVLMDFSLIELAEDWYEEELPMLYTVSLRAIAVEISQGEEEVPEYVLKLLVD